MSQKTIRGHMTGFHSEYNSGSLWTWTGKSEGLLGDDGLELGVTVWVEWGLEREDEEDVVWEVREYSMAGESDLRGLSMHRGKEGHLACPG